MHGQHKLCRSVIGHLKRLFRIAVRMNPRIVRSDRHDREIHRRRSANLAKKIRICCVAREDNPVPTGLNEIPVVSAMNIRCRACAPVLNLQGTNVRWSHLALFAPSQFMNRTISFHAQKVAGANGRNDRSVEILQFPQARTVEMIHMSM